MDKRQAKREAYFHASLMLRNVLEGGWTCVDNTKYCDADAEKIDDALREIVKMLENRASIELDL